MLTTNKLLMFISKMEKFRLLHLTSRYLLPSFLPSFLPIAFDNIPKLLELRFLPGVHFWTSSQSIWLDVMGFFNLLWIRCLNDQCFFSCQSFCLKVMFILWGLSQAKLNWVGVFFHNLIQKSDDCGVGNGRCTCYWCYWKIRHAR